MKKLTAAAAAAMLLGAASLASAQTPKSTNPTNEPPGQAYQDAGKKPVPGTHGASGYTPGHQMNAGVKPKSGSPGASGFAPGHSPSTTGSTNTLKK